jgi:uncharacterized membrane protein
MATILSSRQRAKQTEDCFRFLKCARPVLSASNKTHTHKNHYQSKGKVVHDILKEKVIVMMTIIRTRTTTTHHQSSPLGSLLGSILVKILRFFIKDSLVQIPAPPFVVLQILAKLSKP